MKPALRFRGSHLRCTGKDTLSNDSLWLSNTPSPVRWSVSIKRAPAAADNDMPDSAGVSLVCVFRAQFGQSRSYNSLSHKNLIMNMEPLVPAMPSTNEYEETAADNGRDHLLRRHTPMPFCHRPLESHVLPSVVPCAVGSTHTMLRVLIEQLMLPSLHHCCFP